MEKLDHGDLIIEINNEIAGLIEEINASPQGMQVDFAENLKNVVIDSIMGPFGLSAAMFADKDGGNITTVHNFEQGVVANEKDGSSHSNWVKAKENVFERRDYDARLDDRFPDMKSSDGKYYDGYRKPGAELPEGPRIAARDHVVPASVIERSSRGHMAQTREERVETATQDNNVVLTSFNMNSSKGDEDLMVWADKTSSKDSGKTNAEHYDLDKKDLKNKHDKAVTSVERDQKLAVLKKQATEFLTEGGAEAGKLAIRQVLGMILKELATGLIDDVRHVVREGFKSLEHLVTLLRSRMEAMTETIKKNWADFLAEGAAAGLAGLLSSLVTLLINSFITTAKRLVTILREAVLAVVKSIKLIASPPAGMTGSEIAVEVLKLLSGSLVSAATILLQEAVVKAIEAIPLFAPFAQDIGLVLVTLLSGALGLLTVLAFDRLKSHIKFHNKQLADVHRGHAVAFLKVKQTLLLLDSGYTHVQESASYMQLRLEESWAAIDESSQSAGAAVLDYAEAVDKFRKLGRRRNNESL